MPSRNIIGLILFAVVLVLTAPLWRRVVPRVGQLSNNSANNTNSANFDAASSQTVDFICSDNSQFTVEYLGQTVRLTLPFGEETYILSETTADRYSDGQFTFFTQNNQGFVERNDVASYSNCNPQSALPSPSPTLTPNPSPTLTPTPSPNPTTSPIPGAFLYICQDGRQFQANFYSNQAEVWLDGSTLYLSQVSTGSGARYSDGRVVLNTQGNQAFIDIDGFPAYVDCVLQNGGGVPSPSPRPPNALW